MFHENFDAPSLDDSVTSYSSNPGANAGWTLNSRLYTSPNNCDSSYVTTGDTTILTTDVFSTVGYNTIILSFNHICKVSFFDVAKIEVSNDGGITWQKLKCSEHIPPYPCPPPQQDSTVYFSAASYFNWQPANDSVVPDNSWWKTEAFDLSATLNNISSAMIRFVLYDSNLPGGANNNGWKIDDIRIIDSTLTTGNPVPTLSEEKGVALFPNPANESIVISSDILENKKYEITITDVMGKTCFRTSNSQLPAKINISLLESGIYFISIHQNGSSIKNLKLVKY